MTKQYSLGLKRDTIIDVRDKKFRLSKTIQLPESVSLEDRMDGILNQGIMASCTGHMARQGFVFARKNQNLSFFAPSRLFVYYNARMDKNNDEGATIRNTLKSMARFGMCDESLWPYERGNVLEQPSSEAYKQAINSTGLEYASIDIGFRSFQEALASGHPILFGIDVYKSFYSTGSDGVVSMPAGNGDALRGAHAVIAFGYKKIAGKNYIACRNSWGVEWGQSGNFYLPEDFVDSKQYTFDAWVLTRVSETTLAKSFLDALVKHVNPQISEEKLFNIAPQLYSLFKDALNNNTPPSTEKRIEIMRILAKSQK